MTLDRDAAGQLVHAPNFARLDMAARQELADVDGVIALAERYAAFLLAGSAPADVVAAELRASQARA